MPPEREEFSYLMLRVVPHVDRGEQINEVEEAVEVQSSGFGRLRSFVRVTGRTDAAFRACSSALDDLVGLGS